MRFERIEIQNFASFYGEHAIDLTCPKDKPVVIFMGGTGYGKTSIFDAINWALYGADYEPDLLARRERPIIDYVNETALREAEANDTSVEMSCTLYFEHDDLHYYVSQLLEAAPHRDNKNVLTAIQEKRLTALYEVRRDGNHIKKMYDAIFLNEILPSNVKDYFLFDGDRIYNLTKPEASQEVQDAIYRVVDLELVKNAGTHLEQVAGEYRTQAKREAKGELGDIEDKYNAETIRLAQHKTELDELRQEKQALETQIRAIEDKLANIPDTSELQGRRTELEREETQIGNQIDDLKVKLRSLAATAALQTAHEPTLALIEILDSKREKGEIPKTVSQTLLKDLLRIQTCLCGTEFSEGDQIYQELMKRHQSEQAKSSSQELLNLLMSLKTASELIADATVQLREQDNELLKLTEYHKELGLAIEQIDKDLDKLPKEDVRDLNRQAGERRDALVSNGAKIQKAKGQIEDCEQKINEFKKQREALSKQQAKVRELQQRERLAQQAADEIEKIYEAFAEESRQAVEALTVQEFQHFVESSSGYTVGLSENYELEVLDSNGSRALQRLSMGQSQCLSLAFITAISRVSEKHPPLAIDMPFSRLDRDVHQGISARLPQITSQLLLFLIPEVEWNEVTQANLQHQTSHIYQLDFDKNNRQTQVREL